MKELLKVKNLKTYFFTHEGTVKAVDEVSFSVNQGKTLGLVGESGCGKSVTALSIMRLIPNPPGKIVSGEIWFEGKNLLKLNEKEIRKIRGKKISMIFQEPMTSLDPVFTIGHEIVEAIQLHQGLNKDEAKKKAIEALKIVGIPDAEKRIDHYPHQLSGGMRQRVMIAMALSCNPTLLIADEPTTALDVTIQAQILRLINDLKDKFGASVMLITHNLGVIAEMCDYVAVMYAGHIVEYTNVDTLFYNPLHPYTRGLHKSMPRLDLEVERLDTIKGLVPNLLDLPSGCPFHPRCDFSFKRCVEEMPELIEVENSHLVRCHLVKRSK
ncbi:MAG: dipeptide/oligopeptide/nickel ABC transporter ATP-binding protein [Candidatus Infernicultor aquiphilus]|uniref:Dipeptide/oligopeptide/nickel ABC transporter ATP-binding protein n=1 Tax=Candidatus Infernicultor aquiphilus TaxID=1805029 RepID=A0A1J5GPQ2_9BACT|nr:ABC transporter ATP-binding protein [bacterium]OIP74785.1 MAG: dipeptide/oligopeptide/nickel ABC transporter ATP-binding protein [Candidatus Atribacteria bacterium CG2_30_33_13]PIU24794.1 MAG: dipeptide/oligopeptide/nickel ABC transporter ATP-binding protein [Candidatus Atribacteria bacterium CG08_land_8_20_14_0_20_33_29]PIW11488.1 MAG: dipeptide/oligopeptide/nickel ABC transporter ATP-binding protein [Candidatus Atribacteria bacterium CG17_big_fil_post_rev_8_21_14_2_50_34_11]PIX33283.1 MAG: